MATVRITEGLLEEVKSHMRRQQQAVIQNTVNPQDPMRLKPNQDAIVEAVLTHFWKGYEHLRSVTPSNWLVEHVRLDVRVAELPEVQITRKVFGPPHSVGIHSRSYTEIRLGKEDIPEELYSSMVAFVEMQNSMEVKLNRTREIVLQLLKQSPSVNAAVKSIPDLRLHLPEDIKRRLDAESPQRKAAKERKAREQSAPLDESVLQNIALSGSLVAMHGKQD